MIFRGIFIIFINFVAIECRTTSDQPIVSTSSGRIKGNVLETIWGTSFYSFRGIRYGEPPVGELRFQAPVPVEPWEDIFEATDDGPMCPQPFQPHHAISEDCLRLNVYTKSLISDEGHLKPVIVYIPGGGFYVGSGISTHYGGPQYLLERDIVLVTINYRLGTLGFLALGTKEAPGNAGFKDIVLALRWVKENIVKFGGNPNSVTILGNSAGAMSIPYLMVSTMSQGLFHRGIMMSGGIAYVQSTPVTEQIHLGKRQATIMNCPDTTVGEIYLCLKSVDATLMVDRLYEMFEFGRDNPIILWTAVIEPDYGQERFLTEHPYQALKSGNYMKIPILTGITENELGSSAVDIVKDEKMLNDFDENFERVAPFCFAYEQHTGRSLEISRSLWDGYNMTHPLSAHFLPNINHMFSDMMIGFGVHRLVQIIADEPDSKIFYYKFTYQGRFSHLYFPEDKPYGVEHSDDLFYLFVRSYAPKFKVGDPEEFMIERMTRLWTNFARNGDPRDPLDPVISFVNWEPYTNENRNYLDIGAEVNLRQHLLEDRYSIMDNLFPLNDTLTMV